MVVGSAPRNRALRTLVALDPPQVARTTQPESLLMNLEEVARLAGVSRSTVSRVVNEDSRVSEAVRNRVLHIIREHDYHPNAAARSLASRRTRILGLLIPQ